VKENCVVVLSPEVVMVVVEIGMGTVQVVVVVMVSGRIGLWLIVGIGRMFIVWGMGLS